MQIYYTRWENTDRKEKERAGHTYGYALLSYALRKETGIEELPEIARGKYGKPYFPEYPGLYFNISHCSGMAACVLSATEIGIDVERRRPVKEAAVKKVLTEREQQCLASWSDREEGFLLYWTLKESFIKAIGRGLSYPLREVEFEMGEQIVCSQPGYCCVQFCAEDDYWIAVCKRQKEAENWDILKVNPTELGLLK